jgi:hypothetical protein
MAVVDVTKMWSRDSGNQESETANPIKYNITLTEGYQVLTDDPEDNTDIVLVHPDVPQLGAIYRQNDFIRVKSRNAVRVSPIFWMVVVTYDGHPDPLDMRPDIQWSDVSSSEPIDQDAYGYPILNVNGEPVDGLTKDLADNVLTITRNFSLFNPFLTSLYRDSVNSDVFAKYPIGTARLTSFSAKNSFRDSDDTLGFWVVTAQITFRRGYQVPDAQAWWKRWRNEGLYERVGPVVNITGGGGTGATAVARIVDGAISSISVTSGGYGYTSAPTVTITLSGHPGVTGSGATASALVLNGRVIGITVGSGGTLYTGGFQQAVDDNQNPVTRPVLLKRNGEREYNAQNAVWLVAPVHKPLPYAALGLL